MNIFNKHLLKVSLASRHFPGFTNRIGQRRIAIDAKLSKDPYFILGVDRQTPFPEVKKQYFKLAKQYHPDLNPNNDVYPHCIVLKHTIVCTQDVHASRRSISQYRD